MYTEKSQNKFTTLRKRASWNLTQESDDAQTAFSYFQKQYTDIYNDSFPIKQVKNGYKTRKEWLPDCLK